jgi:riboflavin synthase
MFTGLILGRGKIIEKRPVGTGMVFGIEAGFELEQPQEGESIAVNGVCLTARKFSGRGFLVDVSPESLSRTNLGRLAIGSTVNLERALRLSDRLGGHMVSGHVDATTPVLERKVLGQFVLFTFAIPSALGKYIIEKGSIAIDGISLTVNSCDARSFAVSIIPHSLQVTTLGLLTKGDEVNIEVDLIGKYVEKMLTAKKSESSPEQEGGINPAFLAKHGFL